MRLFIDGQEVPAERAEVSIKQDFETARFLDNREPDPTWVYEDAEGHGHFWALTSYDHYWVPTTEYKIVASYWCEHCNEVHETGHQVCRDCGEVIQPGTRPGPRTKRIAGTTVTEITVHANIPDHREVEVVIEGDNTLLSGRYKGYLIWSEQSSLNLYKTITFALSKES